MYLQEKATSVLKTMLQSGLEPSYMAVNAVLNAWVSDLLL
jgi:hypothetical protein